MVDTIHDIGLFAAILMVKDFRLVNLAGLQLESDKWLQLRNKSGVLGGRVDRPTGIMSFSRDPGELRGIEGRTVGFLASNIVS